ncbi:hypothetical protein ABTN76_19500, partial [Acinetobacter baumannii]
DRFSNAKTVADLLEKWLAYVQQPHIVARPGELKFDTRLTSAEIARRSSESTSQTSDAATADDDIYDRTILFQPISGRMFVFLTLTGMALTLV